MDPVPWRDAWHEALYAVDRGFYVARGGPSVHFTTAAHGPTGAVLARALLALPDHPIRLVVDLGAGRGELATHLLAALDETAGREAPGGEATGGEATVRVVAVDVVDRPAELDARIEWLRSPGGAALPDGLDGLSDAFVIAHEWLDVVPCTVAEVDGEGVLREVLVDPATGAESLGGALDGPERGWVDDHWPTTEPGDRVEVGWSRDLAWAGLVSRVRSGTLVAVDYGHTAATRPVGGTLTAYAIGRQTAPVPDGSCDVTAHVAMDSLDADVVVSQRDALRERGVLGATPAHALASTDPLGYLRGLERAGAETHLIDPAGFGGFWWAVKRVGPAHVP